MKQRGFTLMEVMIALAILGIGLGVLLQAQTIAADSAARSRDLTIAALLARGKMIDIEQKLMDEGFTEGEQEEEGDFTEEKHPEISWKAVISEIEMDLAGLGSMCGGFEEDGGGEGGDCEGMLGGMGGMFEGFTTDLSRSVRLVELTITWSDGPKFKESFNVVALVSKDDFNMSLGNPIQTQTSGSSSIFDQPQGENGGNKTQGQQPFKTTGTGGRNNGGHH